MQATITSKGQVTLPKPIRDRLHLRPGDKIDFVVDADGDLRVVAVTAPVTELKGMLQRPKVPVTLQNMDRAIATAATRRSVNR